MKKLLRFMTAVIVSTAFVGGMASAATCDGTISVTGPGSNNQISCNEVNNIVVTCENNITVGTINSQTGDSGNADGSNNTTSGTVASGSVVNDNGQNVTIGASCGEAASLTSETPGQGGGGGGGAGEAVPEELPNTSSVDIAPLAIGAFIVSVALAALSRLAHVTYRRMSAS